MNESEIHMSHKMEEPSMLNIKNTQTNKQMNEQT